MTVSIHILTYLLAGWPFLDLTVPDGKVCLLKKSSRFSTLNIIIQKYNIQVAQMVATKAHDINEVIEFILTTKNVRGKVTLIAGGPPCQGFSIAGQRNENDERNKLINSYIEFISLVRPKFIFFENVKGFTMEFKNNKQKGRNYSQIVTGKLTKIGYHVYGKLINFGDYGIPQKRTRFILIGIRADIESASVENAKSFFELLEKNKFSFLAEKKLSANPTIEEALSDLLSSETSIETPDRKGFRSGVYQKTKSNYQRYLREENEERFPIVIVSQNILK